GGETWRSWRRRSFALRTPLRDRSAPQQLRPKFTLTGPKTRARHVTPPAHGMSPEVRFSTFVCTQSFQSSETYREEARFKSLRDAALRDWRDLLVAWPACAGVAETGSAWTDTTG